MNDYKWESIDSAPKDGTKILVGFYIATVWIVRLARWVPAKNWCFGEPDDTDGWWSYNNSVTQIKLDDIYEPQYWCPMPKQPEKK